MQILANNQFKNLERNNLLYEYFINKKILEVQGNLSDDEIMGRIKFLAKFAWRNHCGYYSDGRLENILIEYGNEIEKYIDQIKIGNNHIIKCLPGKDYSICHVATKLGEIGGHTRVLWQLLKRNEDMKQVVILTDQNLKDVPKWFMKDIGNAYVVSLASIKSLFERAYILRNISEKVNKVILYHHPDDVIPTIAFAKDNSSPVLLLNHSHSWFWFGSSIADIVIDLSEFHNKFTLKNRPVVNSCYLACTQLDDVEIKFDIKEKEKAKTKLNISSETICIITVGTSEKFIPNSKYNFYTTAQKIIKRFQNVELFVIGIYPDKKYSLDPTRVHFLGPVSDLTDYYKAADISLASLPQPSLGGTAYAAIIGMACPLFKYGLANVFNGKSFYDAKLYQRYIGDPKNEKEYLNKLKILIENRDIRLQIAEELRNCFLIESSKANIDKSYRHLLNISDDLSHSSRLIPVGKFYRDEDSAEIADACSLQDLYSIIRHFEKYFDRRDQINIITRLSTKFIYSIDIMKLAQTVFKRKMRAFWVELFGVRRFLWFD